MAQIKINRDELRKGLQKTTKIAGSAGNTDHMRAYYFVKNGEQLVLASSDLRLTMFANVKATALEEFPVFAVDSKKLDEFVKHADAEIGITSEVNGVTLETGTYKIQLSPKSTDMFSYNVDEGEWEEEWVASKLRFVLESLIAVSDKAHVIDDGDNYIFFDKKRAYCLAGPNLAFIPFETNDRYVFSNEVAKQVLALTSDSSKVKVKRIDDGSTVVMQTESDLFSFRDMIFEKGHDIDSVIEGCDDQLVIAVTKDSLLKTLRRVSLLGSEELEAVLEVNGGEGNRLEGRMEVNAFKDTERCQDNMKIMRIKPIKKERIEFSADIENILLLVNSVPSDNVIVTFTESMQAGPIINIQDETRQYFGYTSYNAG